MHKLGQRGYEQVAVTLLFFNFGIQHKRRQQDFVQGGNGLAERYDTKTTKMDLPDLGFASVSGQNGLFERSDFFIRQEIEVARTFPC